MKKHFKPIVLLLTALTAVSAAVSAVLLRAKRGNP